MRTKIIFLIVLYLLVMGPVLSLPGPGASTLRADEEINLAKIKKEEEERKKQLEKSKKKTVVITNETLKQYETEGENDEEARRKAKAAAAVAKGPETPEKKEVKKADPKQTREYWQKLKADIEKKIVELKAKINKTDLELSGLLRQELSTDMTLQENLELRKKRTTLEEQLKFDKVRLKNLQSQYDSLPEQARKAGVPPGWVR